MGIIRNEAHHDSVYGIVATQAGPQLGRRGTNNCMLSVADATQRVLLECRPLPPCRTPLASALGRRLAEDIASDCNMPPFDKAMMDGYAVRAADVPGELLVVEEITAGRSPTRCVESGQAARIMTGAPLPAGADAVVMIERTEMLSGGNRVRITVAAKTGQHIAARASDLRLGERVLSAEQLLGPAEIGLLATVGRDEALVTPSCDVAVLSTGDELVEPGTPPSPVQIRNSNGPMLTAQVATTGARGQYLGIARDNPEQLRERIQAGLNARVLVLSGGVSAGKLDLVPGILTSLGVEPRFHKVAMKPGKPVFFGVRPGSPSPTLVFGLPGNPVSAFVAFELFVRPAIRALRGEPSPAPEFESLPLAGDFEYATDRPTYHPATIGPGGVRPVEWRGSPDLRALTLADAMCLLPAGDFRHRAGDSVPTYSWCRVWSVHS